MFDNVVFKLSQALCIQYNIHFDLHTSASSNRKGSVPRAVVSSYPFRYNNICSCHPEPKSGTARNMLKSHSRRDVRTLAWRESSDWLQNTPHEVHRYHEYVSHSRLTQKASDLQHWNRFYLTDIAFKAFTAQSLHRFLSYVNQSIFTRFCKRYSLLGPIPLWPNTEYMAWNGGDKAFE